MTCLKHKYRPVNNRYDDQGKQVIEGGEWVTEIRCEVCDEKFEEPKWREEVISDYQTNYDTHKIVDSYHIRGLNVVGEQIHSDIVNQKFICG